MATTGERLGNYFGERKIATADLTTLFVRYWYVGLAIAIVALAAGLRLWDLGARAVHHDESIHIKFAYDITKGIAYTHDPVYHGPFQYFGTAAIFKVFGDSDYTSRLLPALFGIALVGLPFMLRRQLGNVGAMLAAGMLAVSPSILYFSRFARNDVYVLFFTLAIAVCIWRYMEDRRDGWLIAIAPLLALSFAAKEVTFIVAGILLVFVNMLLAVQLVQQWRASREPDEDTARETVIAYVITIPTAWLIASVWSLTDSIRNRFSLKEMPATVPIMIVLGTLCAAQFSAAIQKLPFITDHGYMEEGDLMRWTALLLILGGAYVGLLWNWRVWLMAGVLFYGVFVLFFTSFFTNMPGFWTGIWGSMDYWLQQQGVRRGDQPDYYYFMLLPIYEFLPLIFALGGALFYAFKGKLEQRLLMAAALILITMLSLISDNTLGIIGEDRIQIAFIIAIGASFFLPLDWFLRFLLFWTLSIFFGLTVAGEKMPWLTVHLALPLALLAGRVLNDLFSNIELGFAEDDGKGQKRFSLDTRLVLPIAGIAGLALLAALIFQAAGPASGPGALAWLLSLAAVGVVAWVARNVSWQTAGQVAAVGLIGAMLVFTVRASGTAAYDQGDPNGVPPEMLIYAQGSAGLGLIADNIDQAARESGLGKDLRIVIDNSGNIWPWPWYVRDYNNVRYEGFTEDDFALDPGSVVLISTSNQSKMQPYLDQYQEGIPYTHMWWFPELYKGLDKGDFLGDVFSGDYFSTWRRYFIDRELENASSTSNMIAFFPREFGSITRPPAAPGERTQAAQLAAEDITVLAGAGGELGEVSQPADIAVDADGNVYVVDTLNQRFQVIAPDGTAQAVGEEGTGEGQFGNPQSPDYDVADGPWGIALGPDASVYIGDTWNHRIQKFGADLEIDPTFGIGGLFGPRDVAFLADGSVAVVDTGNKRLAVYDQNGSLTRIIGEPGDGPAQFNEPTSVSVAPDGTVYVADYWNKRIQRFDSELNYSGEFEVDSWGATGIAERAYIAALSDGRVLATDPHNGNIMIFSPEGEEIAARSIGPQISSRPVGVAVDAAEENVYITDGLASQVVRVPLAAFFEPAPAATP